MSDKKLNNSNYTIKVKSWLKAKINSNTTKAQATQWELHFCTDTKELYIFDWTENVKVTKVNFSEDWNDIYYLDGKLCVWGTNPRAKFEVVGKNYEQYPREESTGSIYLKWDNSTSGIYGNWPAIVLGSQRTNSVANVDGSAIFSKQMATDTDNAWICFAFRSNSNSTGRQEWMIVYWWYSGCRYPVAHIWNPENAPIWNEVERPSHLATGNLYVDGTIKSNYDIQFGNEIVGNTFLMWQVNWPHATQTGNVFMLLFPTWAGEPTSNKWYMYWDLVLRRSTSLRNDIRMTINANTNVFGGTVVCNLQIMQNDADDVDIEIVTATVDWKEYLALKLNGNMPRDWAFFNWIRDAEKDYDAYWTGEIRTVVEADLDSWSLFGNLQNPPTWTEYQNYIETNKYWGTVQTLRNKPVDTHNNDYTIIKNDAWKILKITANTASSITIPNNTDEEIPVWAYIEIECHTTQTISIVWDAGVTVNSLNSNTDIAWEYGKVYLRKDATNTWILTGDLV